MPYKGVKYTFQSDIRKLSDSTFKFNMVVEIVSTLDTNMVSALPTWYLNNIIMVF